MSSYAHPTFSSKYKIINKLEDGFIVQLYTVPGSKSLLHKAGKSLPPPSAHCLNFIIFPVIPVVKCNLDGVPNFCLPRTWGGKNDSKTQNSNETLVIVFPVRVTARMCNILQMFQLYVYTILFLTSKCSASSEGRRMILQM